MAKQHAQSGRPSMLPEMCQQCPVRVAGPCSTLDDAALANFAQSASPQVAPRQTTIIRQGDLVRHFYFLKVGTVKVTRSLADGRQAIIGFYFPNDVLGLNATDGYTFSATAMNDVLLCRFDRAEVLRAGMASASFLTYILDIARKELIAAQTQLLVLGQLTAAKRLAAFLVMWCRRTQRSGTPRTLLDLPITRSDIADHLGVATETVSRALRELRQARLIETGRRNQIIIVDLAALERVTGLEDW